MRKMVDGLISSSQLLKRDRGMFSRHRLRPSPGGNPKQSLNLQGNFVYHGNLIRNVDVKGSRDDLCDFLGANQYRRKLLIGFYGEDKHVQVESLRGKILCLYFESPPSGRSEMPCAMREFYNALKLTKPDAFEMIYVSTFSSFSSLDRQSVYNATISTLPCLAVPLDDDDSDWRCYISRSYEPLSGHTGIVFIDTRDNKIEVLMKMVAGHYINLYGPQLFPFTDERIQQLEAQLEQLGKETSIQAILGSDSRDYLIDRHSNKVPISSLQNKDVLIYAYSSERTALDELPFVKQLEEIYNIFPNQSFEIVSINLDHNGGNEKYEKLWKDHLAQIPWLHLPLGDEKIWLLRTMITKFHLNRKGPILCVKPKGESLLDPYGYQIFKDFGIQAYPFSRKAAAHSVVTRLKGLSFKSFVDKARHLGLDFNSLTRNKANGGTEHVSLSAVLEERARGILLFFVSSETCSQKRLTSLINVYLSGYESHSSFEVIFVSMDKDTQFFDDHFSIMPWFAFEKPLKLPEYKNMAKRMTDFDFKGAYSHFLAFGPDQLVLHAGLLKNSFENCEFPFDNDAESTQPSCLSHNM